jgi:methylated-DNA-[protein]-cysteine S-methyltransferase
METDARYTLFDTEHGTCGIAWTAAGVSHFNFPEGEVKDTEARLGRIAKPAGPKAIPKSIAAAIALLQRYFGGEAVDLSSIAVDLTGVSGFHRDVYEAARRLGWGEVVTYGELARRAGAPGAARAVGHALSRNPVAVIVPCHRVLASGNKIGGFSAFGGTGSKEKLLTMEGVAIGVVPRPEEPSLFDFIGH